MSSVIGLYVPVKSSKNVFFVPMIFLSMFSCNSFYPNKSNLDRGPAYGNLPQIKLCNDFEEIINGFVSENKMPYEDLKSIKKNIEHLIRIPIYDIKKFKRVKKYLNSEKRGYHENGWCYPTGSYYFFIDDLGVEETYQLRDIEQNMVEIDFIDEMTELLGYLDSQDKRGPNQYECLCDYGTGYIIIDPGIIVEWAVFAYLLGKDKITLSLLKKAQERGHDYLSQYLRKSIKSRYINLNLMINRLTPWRKISIYATAMLNELPSHLYSDQLRKFHKDINIILNGQNMEIGFAKIDNLQSDIYQVCMLLAEERDKDIIRCQLGKVWDKNPLLVIGMMIYDVPTRVNNGCNSSFLDLPLRISDFAVALVERKVSNKINIRGKVNVKWSELPLEDRINKVLHSKVWESLR